MNEKDPNQRNPNFSPDGGGLEWSAVGDSVMNGERAFLDAVDKLGAKAVAAKALNLLQKEEGEKTVVVYPADSQERRPTMKTDTRADAGVKPEGEKAPTSWRKTEKPTLETLKRHLPEIKADIENAIEISKDSKNYELVEIAAVKRGGLTDVNILPVTFARAVVRVSA